MVHAPAGAQPDDLFPKFYVKGSRFVSISWNSGSAAERFRHNLRLKKNKKKKRAPSAKLQAPSLKRILEAGQSNKPQAPSSRLKTNTIL